MEIGEKIKVARKSKGMTQKRLAELIGTSDSAIRKYESETLTPKLDTVARIASALKMNPMELLPDWFLCEVNKYATP